jgi:hypothetical protein
MLKTLSKLESSQAQLVLSKLTKSFVPTPYEAKDEIHDDLYKEVLTEVFDKLQINKESLDAKDRQKILSFLLDEMKSLTLDDKKAGNIKERLGEKGELASSQYEIKFGDTAKNFKARGIGQSEIIKTIKHPDSFSHLHRGQVTNENLAPISIYVKRFRHRNEDLLLIVETKREGYTLLVSTAWKIFLSDVGIPESNDVLSLLEKFVDIYGIEISIANSVKRKFFLYETIPMIGGNNVKVFEVHAKKGDSFEVSSLIRQSPLDVIEVSIAYAINTTKYINDLKRHGINIKSKKA